MNGWNYSDTFVARCGKKCSCYAAGTRHEANCSACQDEKEEENRLAWVTRQPPMAEILNPADCEDSA